MCPIHLRGGAAASCLFLPIPVMAQVRDAGKATIVVTGQRNPLNRDTPAQAASRPNLSVRETPVSVEILTEDDRQRRGPRTEHKTAAAVAETVSCDAATTSTVMRRNASNRLHDRVEVLKGPVSILFAAVAAGRFRLTTRASVWHASNSCSDTANTIRVTGRSLGNATCGEDPGYPAANVCIGASRSFETALATRF